MRFRDGDGVAANPTALVVTTRSPSGTQTPYTQPHATITQADPPITGEWFFRFPTALTEIGSWWVYVDGDDAVSEIEVEITASQVLLTP